ncbi:MAG: hypothetical protein NTW75_00170 [Planctomycetales bacterium]|nr:hypothetical protein [Planctomycetales bacterium]
MDYFFNEFSFHGQFRCVEEFHLAVETVMGIRAEITRCGSQLFCSSTVWNAQVTAVDTMQQAIKTLERDKQTAWKNWLSKSSWSSQREHSGDDYLQRDPERNVTDSSIGEVAYRNLNGLHGELVTVAPSDWLRPSLSVILVTDSSVERTTDVTNHWTRASVVKSLEAAPRTYDSWKSLEEYARRKCALLKFADDAFEKLRSYPYQPGQAERIESLLTILNKLHGCSDNKGTRTAEGDAIYADHFGRQKGWFTDSSDREKKQFKKELTFDHPGQAGKDLFCSWHGKVKTNPPIRIHFSWPRNNDGFLYVVYVGPKITK